MAIKSKTVEHIYNDYNLYGATYSRCPSYKFGEALGALFIMNELRNLDPKNFSEFNVLEILAGHSEHQKYMMEHGGSSLIKSYHYLDSEDDSNGHRGVIVGDALYVDIDPGLGINFITGFFFSASSVLDLNGSHRSRHARSVVAQLYKNMYRGLPEVGAFILDYANNGYYSALCATKGEEEEEFDVPFYHPLRKEYGLPSHGKCLVKLTRKSVYNRLTSENSDIFTKPVVIEYEGTVVGRVTVRQPMTQRYFSEPELVDMAHEAGFTKVMLLKNDYVENDFEVLPDLIELDEGDEIDDNNLGTYVGNTIVAIKGC